MIDLPHVTSRVFGTPLMIARAKLEVILGVLAPRLAGSTSEPIDAEADRPPQTSITVERIAVVSVIGTLVSRSGYLAAASGLVSYADIGDAIAAAMDDPTARGVILDVDSPGGEVGGLFDLVEQIGAIKTASAKPLWAVANESALSAAYAVASAADRVYVTRTGEVGSIGVVAVHVDESGADAKAGLAWTFVFAGERKIDANGHEPLSERARAAIQTDVDRLYAELCGLVAANRGLTNEAMRATDAAIYRGELAIRAGLADRVGTLDLAIAEMAAELDRTPSVARTTVNPTPKRSPSMATNETERIQRAANEPPLLPVSQQAAQVPAPNPEPAPQPMQTPAPESAAEPAPSTRSGGQAACRVCRNRSACRAGGPPRRHDRRGRRHAQGHFGRCAAPLRAGCARRARRGDERHRCCPIHAHRGRQPDRAAREGARSGGSRLIIEEHQA